MKIIDKDEYVKNKDINAMQEKHKKHKKRRMQILEFSEQAQERFLDAWKLGVLEVGPRYFDGNKALVHAATDKNELRPNVNLIREDLHHMRDSNLAAVMVSFYNGLTGFNLMQDIGLSGMAVIAEKLSFEGKKITSDLLRNYSGW